MSRILFIDTETGGLDPSRNSILSVGAVVWEEGRILAELEVRVSEKTIRAEPEALRINGIDISNWKLEAVPPLEAVKELEHFILQHFPSGMPVPLGGHNTAFDIGFLRRLYRIARRSYALRFSHRVIDTASIMGFLIVAGRLPIPSPSLDAGLRHFGIEVSKASRHTAIADARATALLFTALLELVVG